MDNLYKRTIDSISISEEAVNKALTVVKEHDTVGKETELKSKKKIFTMTGALAASLAIIIALGAAFYPGTPTVTKDNKGKITSQKSRNSFFITANAAEATGDEAKPQTVSNKEFVQVGEVSPLLGTIKIGDSLSFGWTFGMDLNCQGKDIETVDYKINQGSFLFDGLCNQIIPVGKKTDIKKEFGIGYDKLENGKEAIYGYKAFRVNYNNQPCKSKRYSFNYPVMMQAKLDNLNKTEIEGQYGYFNFDNDNAMLELTNKMVKDIRVTVTANFKDGTTETQTLKFQTALNKNNNLILKAKVLT